jgi:hypothetical protein
MHYCENWLLLPIGKVLHLFLGRVVHFLLCLNQEMTWQLWVVTSSATVQFMPRWIWIHWEHSDSDWGLEVDWMRIESWELWSEDASPNLNSLGGRWFRLASRRPSWWGGGEDGTNELGACGWLWLRAKTHDLNAPVEVLNLCQSIITTVTSALLSFYVYAMLLPLWFAWTRSRSDLYFCRQ